MGGAKVNRVITQGKVALQWHGYDVPSNIDYIGDETVHPVHQGKPIWRCWWYKNGKMDSITLDADIPYEERILTTLTIMRMSDGNISEGEGSSPS